MQENSVKAMLIFLIGFMGCGKSTIGRRVAKRLGYDFMDTDQIIAERYGKPIADIFREQGEQAFRMMEREVIEGIDTRADAVVATGGGLPCFGDNMQIMTLKGQVVYFSMTPSTLYPRLEKGKSRRPKLAGMDGAQLAQYISQTLAEREPYYQRASMIIDCNGVSDEYIASHISRLIGDPKAPDFEE